MCDYTDPAALTALLTGLPDRIDVPVNNAGGNTDLDADGEHDLASYARAFSANLGANLLSAVLTTKALDERLAAGGAVVHIGSIAAEPGGGSYGAAKAGFSPAALGRAAHPGQRVSSAITSRASSAQPSTPSPLRRGSRPWCPAPRPCASSLMTGQRTGWPPRTRATAADFPPGGNSTAPAYDF